MAALHFFTFVLMFKVWPVTYCTVASPSCSLFFRPPNPGHQSFSGGWSG